MTLSLASRETPAGAVWDGELHTSSLKAVRDGKPLEWAEPLSVEFSGRLPAGHLPTFDKFICRSDFVAVTARGSAESFKAAANVHLDRLAARLSEFADLGGVALDGKATVRVEVGRNPAAGDFKAGGSVELTGFAFADPGGHHLREPQLTLRLETTGHYLAGQKPRLDTGSLALAAGEDALEVKLLAPVADLHSLANDKASVRIAGDLGRWKARAAGFAGIPAGWVVGGSGTASAVVRFTGETVAVDGLKLDVERAASTGPAWI